MSLLDKLGLTKKSREKAREEAARFHEEASRLKVEDADVQTLMGAGEVEAAEDLSYVITVIKSNSLTPGFNSNVDPEFKKKAAFDNIFYRDLANSIANSTSPNGTPTSIQSGPSGL